MYLRKQLARGLAAIKSGAFPLCSVFNPEANILVYKIKKEEEEEEASRIQKRRAKRMQKSQNKGIESKGRVVVYRDAVSKCVVHAYANERK